jgi:predicted DNA-binding antitoxin AbrB/MazE fold protein
MVQEIEAVYENGVLRPLSPVRLSESETVHVRISTGDTGMSQLGISQLNVALIERARAELASRAAVPSIEEVQQAAAVIPGNWSDDIIAERGEY